MEKEKLIKNVLIVDDDQGTCDILETRFELCKKSRDCPFLFNVERAYSKAECIEKIRNKEKGVNYYDVLILDIKMEKLNSGLEVSLALALRDKYSPDKPIRIIFTGHQSYARCVQAMRNDAWDFIVKEDKKEGEEYTPAAQLVVNSAVLRLRQIELRKEQEKKISAQWLPHEFYNLKEKYKDGRVLALWHEPEVTVIADGEDVFELEENLAQWRKDHNEWEEPYIVEIPKENQE